MKNKNEFCSHKVQKLSGCQKIIFDGFICPADIDLFEKLNGFTVLPDPKEKCV